MHTRFMFFIVLSLLLLSCGTRSDKSQQADSAGMAVLTVDNFDAQAGDFIGKEVQIEGLVDHVCRHGGKRMFLVQTEGEGRVKVVTGETIPAFDVELEGHEVIVNGIVDELRVDEQYLAEWEKELTDQEAAESETAGAQEHAEGSHTGLGEQADQGTHDAAWDQISGYRAQIAASEKGYLSFYSIICSEFKKKEN